MTFNPDTIKGMAGYKAGKTGDQKVTRQDAKNRVNQLLMHEGASHGGLFSF